MNRDLSDLPSFKCPHPHCKCYQTCDEQRYINHLNRHGIFNWGDIMYLVESYKKGTGL